MVRSIAAGVWLVPLRFPACSAGILPGSALPGIISAAGRKRHRVFSVLLPDGRKRPFRSYPEVLSAHPFSASAG